MISGNDKNQRRNAGRLRPSSLSVGQIKKQIEKGINKETFENIKESKPIKDLKGEIWERLEEENKIRENKEASSYRARLEGYEAKESLKEEFEADQARVKNTSVRQANALKHKKKATKEAEKEVNKKLKEMGQGSSAKRKVASKVTGKAMSEMAYRIAQKMEEEINKGGINTIVIILVTLFIAIWTDTVDILTEIGVVAAVVSVIGAIPGAALGFVIWASNLFLSLIIIFFWMAVLGGGHKKFFWKRLIRLIFFVVLVEAIPIIDLLPWAIVMVCWNWFDLAKDKRKATKDFNKFKTEFKATGKINKKYAGYV